MFSLRANPDYVPGGVQNFWTSTPTGQAGQMTAANVGQTTSNVGQMTSSDGGQMPTNSLSSWFFGGGESDKSCGMGISQGSKTILKEVAINNNNKGWIVKERKAKIDNWRMEELNLPIIFKFQQFTQFNDCRN